MNDADLIAWIDGEGTPAERAAVETALDHGVDLRRRLAILLRQRLLLAEACRDVSQRTVRPTSSRRLRPASMPTRRPLPWLVAATLLCALGLGAVLSWPRPAAALTTPTPSATVTYLHGTGAGSVIRAGNRRPASDGVMLATGDRIEITAGLLVIAFSDSTQVELNPRTRITLLPGPGQRLELSAGSIAAAVRPQPAEQPFTVLTPTAEVTVVGTRFTLAVDDHGSQLAVAHGVVRLTALGDGRSAEVHAGGKAAVASDGRLREQPALQPPPRLATAPRALLPAHPLASASVATEDGLGVVRETIAVSGQPFASAMRIATPPLAMQPDDRGEHALRLRIATTAAIAVGDAVLARLWLRSAGPGTASARVVFEGVAEPHRQALSVPLTVDGNWRRIELPFTANAAFSAGEAELQVWLGQQPQTIDVGGFELDHHGQLPLTALPFSPSYAGHEADAPWRAEALARLERERQSDVLVTVVDAAGTPVADASVQIVQSRGPLTLAGGIASERVLGTSNDDARYRAEFARRFTMAVPTEALKWPAWDNDRAGAEAVVDQVLRSGLTVRGHSLLWPDRRRLPPAVLALLGDPPALRARILARCSDTVSAFAGRVVEWDVVDDPYSAGDLFDAVGTDTLTACFAAARRADPRATLALACFGVLEDGGEDSRRQAYYERLITDLLAAGAPLDALALHCHQDWHLTPPARLIALIDRFARFGLPIRISEFEVDLADETLQADYTRDALTALASHPAVTMITAWALWAGDAERPAAALLNRDWTPRPAALVWDELTLQRWRTERTLRSDAAGRCALRAWRGKLRVTVSAQGSSAEVAVELGASAKAVVVRLPISP